MSRLLFEHDGRTSRGGEPARSADEASQGRSSAAIGDETGGARIRRQRDDPAGRRSLTGLEFRRQRSI
jgi:hypothetical protein